MANTFENDDSRALDATERAAYKKANQYVDLACRKVMAEKERDSAHEALILDPTHARAHAYVDAKAKAEHLTAVVEVLDTAGGIVGIKAKILAESHATPLFNRGFAARIAALEKLIPPARKRLGARISELVEAGTLGGLIEADHVVSSTRGYIVGVEAQLATARHCAAEGAPGARATRDFCQLYSILTGGLPVPPPMPAA